MWGFYDINEILQINYYKNNIISRILASALSEIPATVSSNQRLCVFF